ncbi:MAG: M20 family metallo-hydrolase [Dysgonamonadaceae bacterium]|jgi:acetylornithine deacetylase|nr:M20 family metallo-hydrolase [Dysgonamonadaceae bacterium]
MDIDASFYDSPDLLKQLIARPSFSREEADLADFLENYLKERKLVPYRKGNNIWLLSPDWDNRKPVVLLNSHIDTVKPVAGWTKDPFYPVEEKGKIYGLGSNDAGASLVSLLQVFLILSETRQENNFIFLASCEEEVSGTGGIESVLPLLPPVDWAIVGEPTGMQPAIAEKGLMVLDATVYGKSGHAARDEGENAIYKAIPVIEWFRNKQFTKVSPLSGAVKMTITVAQAGTQHNVIPDECKLTIDVRTNECYTNEELFTEIASACGCEIKARSFRLNASHISPGHPLVKRAVLLGLTPFSSPTLSDQALMHFPSLKIGPGESSRSHTADEFICLHEIRDAVDIYLRLLNHIG